MSVTFAITNEDFQEGQFIIDGATFRRARETKVEIIPTGWVAEYTDTEEELMVCKNCDSAFGFVTYDEDGGVFMHVPPAFCPECGAAINGAIRPPRKGRIVPM